MGFLDKAKKLAEQAQNKLDEVQTQINERQGASPPPGGPVAEYDQHGRPVPPEQTTTPPHGDPLRRAEDAPAAPSAAAPPADPIAPVEPAEPIDPAEPVDPIEPIEPIDPDEPTEPAEPVEPAYAPDPRHAGVAGAPAPPAREDDPYTPPKLTGGDPLAG